MNSELHTFAICAYGESPYLEQCIRSLLNQTVKSRVICCTATPSPWLRTLTKKYEIPLFVRQEKPGIREDWLFAYQTAKSALVTIAHQDDIYRKNYTEELLRAYKKWPDMTVFASDYLTIRMRNGKAEDDSMNLPWLVKKVLRLPLRVKPLSGRTWVKKTALLFGNSICCPSCTYHKERIGEEMFDSSYRYALDWDNLLDLAEREGRFVVSEKPLIAYRIHDGSATKALIVNRERFSEEESMFRKMLPGFVADLILRFYGYASREYD